MLPATVRQGSSPACWKAIPYSWSIRARRAGLPNTSSVPEVGVSRSAISRSSVLLPQPLGPISETNSPGATVEIDIFQRDDRDATVNTWRPRTRRAAASLALDALRRLDHAGTSDRR